MPTRFGPSKRRSDFANWRGKLLDEAVINYRHKCSREPIVKTIAVDPLDPKEL
jgi:hypothetical protein